MKHQEILNLMNDANDSKFLTRKWNIANDNSKAKYRVEVKLSIIQKFLNLIFVITTMLIL